jgi:hypothetical protein
MGSRDSRKVARTIRVSAALVLALLMMGSPVCAQVTGGMLSGIVIDPTGAHIPAAQVVIANTATGVSHAVETDKSGFYAVPNLLAGSYKVTITAPGFAAVETSGVALTVGGETVLNVTMHVGAVAENVQVTAEGSAVDLASSSVGGVVNATAVRELPLNGRSWTELATLEPGVSAIQTQISFGISADRGNRGFGSQVAISGARPVQNNYRLDGISINDYANGAPGSILGGNVGVDAVQEFSVLTSNASAEYGKSSGGIVNAITRSGTNQFHGSAYEFLRNSALDARNYFDGPQIPPFKRNQFGASAGGPIRKDKTFVFGNYEGVRQSKGVSVLNIVPSAAARAGNLSTGKVTVDPAVLKYLPLYPLPNGPLLAGGDTGTFTLGQQQAVTENFYTTRVDHRLSEKDSLFGTYMYDNAAFSFPDNFNNVLIDHASKRQVVVLEEEHTFNPRLFNIARIGFNREVVADEQSVQALNPLAADKTLGANPGQFAAQVVVTGLSLMPGGLGGASTFFYNWNSFQGYDDAFLTLGRHSLKFGGGAERMQLNYLSLGNPNGQFSFGSLSKFLTNQPSKYASGSKIGLTERGLRQTIFGAYVQDDWHWHHNVTINLGVRYEMSTVPTEVHGELSTLINLTDATPHLGDPYFQNPTTRNFEPRVGFAWDPFRSGKTSVRGGFGIYDVLPLTYQFNLLAAFSSPFYTQLQKSGLPAGTFFTGAAPLLTVKALRVTYLQPKPPRTYVEQWNLAVQRELGLNLTAMVGYVGSHGVHQPFKTDAFDTVIPKLTTAGYLYPSPIGSGALFNPNYGSIRGITYNSSSSYNALELQLTKRMTHGVYVKGSYTWARSIDNNSATLAGDAFSNSISALNWYDLRLSRGLSDFDIRQTLVISGNWDVPQIKSLNGPAAWAVNGWQFRGVLQAHGGVPFTPLFGSGGDPLGSLSGSPFDYPNRLGGSGCATLTNPGNRTHYIKTECFAVPTAPDAAFYAANCDPKFGVGLQCFNLRGNAGRNILVGPGAAALDFSVFKNNYVRKISENFNVQFRMEAFNILNRSNFAPPTNPDNTTIFDASGARVPSAGLLTSTTTTAREIQFALKVIW